MREPVEPPDEAERLAALRRLNILDSPPEARFDLLTQTARGIIAVASYNVLRKLRGDLLTTTYRAVRSACLHVGRLGLRLTDADLVQVVRDVVEGLGPLLGRAGCPVDLRASGPVIGRWDPEKLAHVVTNLLSNALKFGEGAVIEVTVQAAGPSALLTVTDHGVGIDPDALPHVFEKFERGVSAQNYGGLGVGLFIVQEVVHALGGAVRVESVPGDHTTFTVELPLEGPRGA
jgi:signal transduction histidine kinase